MNQSVIFTDQLYIEADAVKFIAQQQGIHIACFISFSLLSQLNQDKFVDANNAEIYFELCRFDIEDKAEALIEEEAFSDKGDIQLI